MITIQDLVIYCATHKYPLTARIAVDIEDGDNFDMTIEGVHGHGHDEPETLILSVIKYPQKSINRDLDKEREILEDRKNPPMPAKYTCESCADTVCGYAGKKGTACERFKDNRNYPIDPPQVLSDDSPTALVACCGNCAERLQLKGCSRYDETNEDGCCIDHKFLSEGASK